MYWQRAYPCRGCRRRVRRTIISSAPGNRSRVLVMIEDSVRYFAQYLEQNRFQTAIRFKSAVLGKFSKTVPPRKCSRMGGSDRKRTLIVALTLVDREDCLPALIHSSFRALPKTGWPARET